RARGLCYSRLSFAGVPWSSTLDCPKRSGSSAARCHAASRTISVEQAALWRRRSETDPSVRTPGRRRRPAATGSAPGPAYPAAAGDKRAQLRPETVAQVTSGRVRGCRLDRAVDADEEPARKLGVRLTVGLSRLYQSRQPVRAAVRSVLVR